MVMDFHKTVRRRSLPANRDAQPPRTTQVTDAKTKRRSWAFNTTDGARVSEAEEPFDPDSFTPPPQEHIFRSTSSASLTQLSKSSTRDLNPEAKRRPKSSSGVSDSSVSRSLSQRAGALPTIMEKKYVEISVALQSRNATPKVKRWDARTRTTSHWDGLRRDAELYLQRGNCSIHLYEKGQSKRGPSLKVPMDRIYSARFASLFTLFHTEISRNGLNDGLQYGDLDRQCDLYIPAPDESSRMDAFTWHITTRNFFAFILGRPLVGVSLGLALIELKERLNLFRPNDPRNHGDLMAYLERLGYLEFAHCRDYALALLNFAEHYHMHELWVDAFVHCVGMNEILSSSSEFQHVSCVTNALITRAYLEMDLHLGRVTRALSNFLEEDFSPSYFGASSGARIHLDRFRTFLHSYYVEKFGYWPPPKGSHFSKSLYKSMYFDLRGLYDFLVDLDSNDSLTDQKPALGGICVLQNVKAFDDRHKFIPLPHPHPLLPKEATITQRTQSQRSLRAFKLGAKPDPNAELSYVREALSAATNSSDTLIADAPLVRAYKRFEREYVQRQEEKVSVSDARKVRWLLIYGTLQMLVSVMRAPKEVRVTETTYPLCCLVTGTPPWAAGTKAINSPHHPSVLPASPVISRTAEPIIDMSVQPDCENDMDDYFAPTSKADRRLSSAKIEIPTPTSTPPSRASVFRNASLRSVKNFSTTISSFSPRSSRRNSTQAIPQSQRTTSNFCEILVQGYGNGLNEAILDPSKPSLVIIPSELSAEVLPEIVVSTQSPPPTPQRKDRVKRRSSRSSQPTMLELKAQQAPEPSRTPLMDSFTMHQTLPGLEELSALSNSSSSSGNRSPPTPLWSSRSNSVNSSASSHSNNTSRRDSSQVGEEGEISPILPSFSAASFLSSTLSPIPFNTPRPSTSVSSPRTTSFPRPSTAVSSPTSPSFSRPMTSPGIPSKASMDLPMVVDIEEMQVYKPTGLPSTTAESRDAGVPGAAEDEEFPMRKNEVKRRSLGGNLKSSLRRTKASGKTVRIKEDVTRLGWRHSIGVASH